MAEQTASTDQRLAVAAAAGGLAATLFTAVACVGPLVAILLSVVDVQADLKTKTATVDFIDGVVVTIEQILDVIKNDVGFEATCTSNL